MNQDGIGDYDREQLGNMQEKVRHVKAMMHQKGEEMQKARNEQLSAMVSQILTHDAKERLNCVALVRPQTAKLVSERLVTMAQSGRLGSKIDDQQLIKLLEQVQEATSQPLPKITFQRKGDSEFLSTYVNSVGLGTKNKSVRDSDSDESSDSSSMDESESY